MRKFLLVTCVALFIPVMCGCGNNLVGVTGTVMSEGQPLTDVWVEFNPAEGRGSGAVTDASGKYELTYKPGQPGATPGVHTVTIGREAAGAHGEGGGKRTTFKFTETVEVGAGSETFDFDVPAKAIPKKRR